MIMSPISNSKLHCCLAVLILFILIFLSLPLLLIYLANTRYEEWQNQRTQIISSTNSNNKTHQSILTPQIANNSFQISPIIGSQPNGGGVETIQNYPTPPSVQITNCTQFAFQANLSLADENFQCPIGTFPCQSCPDICIEQRRNCDGNADCPDRSDESSCHDSNGAIGIIFQNIVNIAAKKKQSTGSVNGSTTNLAKPDSCTLDQFVEEQCPCVYSDPRVIICEGLGLTSVPSTLLSSVYKIRMSNNSIASIDNVLWPRSLSSLVLVNNRIVHIARSTFEMAPNLSKLYLSHNEISYIDNEAFFGLTSLTSLQIEANKLQTFDSKMLIHTPAISKIYLSENMIDLPDETRFGHCQNLKELLLDHNRISVIRSHWFSNVTSLIWLSLTHNEISVIEDGSFDWDYDLEELNLSFNKIKVINRKMFAKSLNIQRLYLGGNPLQPLPIDAFREIVQLKSLNLTHVQFDYINRGTFSYLTQLEFIYFAKFRYCHYATHVRVCRPLTDGLSSVEELLAFPILKYAVWIVASVCSLGNVLVFIWRSVSPHEDRTLSLFVKNLSIADLMMGIYLGAIGWQDWKFQHNFGHHAIEWMSSWTCTAIGFLAILSSELSVFILTIITIERYRSIMSISRFEEETQKRRARVYVTMAWLFSFLIAFYPLVEWLLRNSDYYATNGLCLPLHIDQPFTPGWQYSAFIYLGINFSAVMIIIALYVHMYSMIMDGRQATRPVLFKAEKREDAILAIRFFFIVVTDCLCWIPIVVIKVMALANVSISSSIYGWLVVFIIPINSALNPIVYTLAAPTSLRAAVFRLFESICYKLDSWTASGSHYSSSSNGSANLDNSHITSAKRRKNTGSTNSTTCDTFDSSIATSNPKASVESALIHSHSQDINNSLLNDSGHHLSHEKRHFSSVINAYISRPDIIAGSVSKSSPSLNPTIAADIDDDGGDCGDNFDKLVGGDNGASNFCHHHRCRHHKGQQLNGTSSGANQAPIATTTAKNATANYSKTKAPFDCISTYGDNLIKHEIITAHRTVGLTNRRQDRDVNRSSKKLATYRNRKGRQLIVYDPLERRTSFDGGGVDDARIANSRGGGSNDDWFGGGAIGAHVMKEEEEECKEAATDLSHCDGNYDGRFNVRRFTSPSYDDDDALQMKFRCGRVVVQVMATTSAIIANKEAISGDHLVTAAGRTVGLVSPYIVEPKIEIINNACKDSGKIEETSGTDDTANNFAAEASSQQSRVSFSSRDSRTCLLSNQHDTC